LRKLPRLERLGEKQDEVLVARIVMRGLIEALDRSARAFEHLREIGVAEEQRAGDVVSNIIAARDKRMSAICCCSIS
jgi:hypothetical protein